MIPSNFFDTLLAPGLWFSSLVEGVGLTSFIMGVVIAALVTRFLLLPFFRGSLGSDGVKNRKKGKK